jgi:hypothetical protein
VGDPTMIDTLLGWQRDTLERCRTVMVGQVVSYSDPPPRAAIQPVLQGRDAVGTRAVPPVLPRVPVLWPSFGGFRIQGMLVPGDEVVLLVSDRALDRWLTQGGVVDLESDRTHHLADALALPCIRTAPRVATPSLDRLTIGRDDGSAVLTIALSGADVTVEAPQVRLGSGAGPTDGVAIARLVHDYLTALFAAGIPVAMDGGAALQTAWQLYLSTNPPASFAATKAIAEGPP